MIKRKTIVALMLVASFLVSLPAAGEPMHADTAEEKKEQAENDLDEIESEIDDIEDEKDRVEGEIADARSQLAKLLAQQEELEADIDDTQADIEQTQIELDNARKEADAQYEAMVIRIQYMYENSTADSFWLALLESDGIADFLKRVEYISTIHKADKQLTEEYAEVVATVEAKEKELLAKMDELLVKQETYLGRQAEIETALASLEESQEDYENQLVDAREQADKYKKIIAEQDEIIKRRDEENKKKDDYNDEPGDPNASGTELVNFALQFVGNPYVWGGNSLTNGCDCSGFVHLVYKHFGYNTVRYSMSFANEGRNVDCVSNGQADTSKMLPGDVVVYERNRSGVGHVGIYIGNGKIVEAQSSNAGITSNRNVNCRGIVAVRRLLKNP